MTGSKQLLWLAAIVMFFIAAVTGSPSYFLADFIGIAIAVGTAYSVMGPPPAPPRNDPPKPPSALPPAPPKPETRVIVERKSVQSSLPQAEGNSLERSLWLPWVIGLVLLFFWLIIIIGSSDHVDTEKRTESVYNPTTSSLVENPNPTYNTPTVQRSRPVPPSKPSTPKAEPDPFVKEIQNKLLSLGYFPGAVDGYIGKKTLNAIKQFQQENSFPIDLEISEKLLSNLNLSKPRVSRQVRQNQVQNRQQTQPDSRNQDTNRSQDECIKIKREMNVYLSRVDQKDIDAIVKYDQLYKKYQQNCRNF